MKESRRVKINFESISEGKYTIIPPEDIAETNRIIKKNMSEFIRKNKHRIGRI